MLGAAVFYCLLQAQTLLGQAPSSELSQCYDDVSICLWTDGTRRTFSDAVEFCLQRNNSFLPRVTDSDFQSKLQQFLQEDAWIEVTTSSNEYRFHWIDGSYYNGDIGCAIQLVSWGNDDESRYIQQGYIDANGDRTWTNKRGLNTTILNVVNCSAYDLKTFDTHKYVSEQTRFDEYMDKLPRGTIVLVTSADDIFGSNDNVALKALNKIGVDASGVGYRGKVAFLAIIGSSSATLSATGPRYGNNIVLNINGVGLYNSADVDARYVVLTYNPLSDQFIFTARRWNDAQTTAYICQKTGDNGLKCDSGELSHSSTQTCYRKIETFGPVTWFSASNDCLSRGGSLAVLSDLGRSSSEPQLINWLHSSSYSYWIGLVKQWWISIDADGRSVDVQYSNWLPGEPRSTPSDTDVCVVKTKSGQWKSWKCDDVQTVVCQNFTVEPGVRNDAMPSSSNTNNGSTKDVVLAVGLAVGITCFTIIVIVVAALIFRYMSMNKAEDTRDASCANASYPDDSRNEMNEYGTLDRDENVDQTHYDVLQLDNLNIH